MGSSSGLGAAFYCALEKRWLEAGAAIVIGVLMFLHKPVLRFWTALKLHTEERLNRGADRLGQRVADEGARFAYKLWVALFSDYEHRYCKQIDFTLRTFRTQGLKEGSAFALDLEHVYVPLRVAPTPAAQVRRGIADVRDGTETRQIWDFIHADAKDRRFVLLARPGAGKTTLLEHLSLTFARGTQRRIHPRAPRLLPILLYLRDIRMQVAVANPPNLSELLSSIQQARRDASQDLTPPEDWFKDRLTAKQSRCLVMLDGLDEVANDAEREAVGRWVDAQMGLYPNARFILSSRPQGYWSAELRHVEVSLEVLPLSYGEVKTFVDNWFLQNEIRYQGRKDPGVVASAADKSRQLMRAVTASDALSELAINPLLLTMITTVLHNQGAVPDTRVALYKEICEVMLVRRQRSKGLEDSLNSVKKLALLQRLALALMLANTRSFDLPKATEWLGSSLAEVTNSGVSAQAFVEGIARESGLLVERERGQYELCHKSLQEYLAATEIKETKQVALLVAQLDEPWWEETIRLYAGQSDTAELIQAALAEPNVHRLRLAYDCMVEGKSTPVSLREALVRALETGLESEDPAAAQLAAEVRLSQRVRSLIRIDEGVQIDSTLVTCAEYQLFVDQQPQFAPSHWEGAHFPRGQARAPVTGLSPQAATTFCAWLSGRLGGKTCRLPHESEATAHVLPDGATAAHRGGEPGIGYWTQSSSGIQLREFSAQDLRLVANTLLPAAQAGALLELVSGRGSTPQELVPDSTTLVQRASQLYSAPCLVRIDYCIAWLRAYLLEPSGRVCGLLTLAGLLDAIQNLKSLLPDRAVAAQAHAHALARDLDLDRDRALLDLDLDRSRALLDLDRALGLDLALALDLDLDRAHALALDLARAFARSLGLARDVDLARRARAFALARALARDVDLARRSLALAADVADLARQASACEKVLHGYLQLSGYCRGLLSNSRRDLPSLILETLLRTATEEARQNVRFLALAAGDRKVRNLAKLDKRACEEGAERYQKLVRELAPLLAWAELYAAREEQRHPGWEGLRVVYVRNATGEAMN